MDFTSHVPAVTYGSNPQAFNEELDGMYNDANLPENEAWTSMTQDLRKTKEARNALTKENS